jgi:ATP-dependent helicase/DNAse subunit B
VQYRLLRSIVIKLADEERLTYYAPLRDKPGFVVALRALVEELKRARIHRDDFEQAIQALPHLDTRLTELVEIYTAYQAWLLDQGWADTEGQGWLAASALERQPDLGRHLRLLLIDGFDEFNPSQLAVLKLLANRATETIITLTGVSFSNERGTGEGDRPAFRRFSRALQALSRTLNLEPEPLPEQAPSPFVPALAHLEAHLFSPQPALFSPKNETEIAAITLIETQNHAEEVRAALRWLKVRLIRDRMALPEVALIARHLTHYRPFIEEIAAEFGLTLYLREGLSLASNPAIAALMALLALPLNNPPEGDWVRRPLLDTWRNPYFENLVPDRPADAADQLDDVARQGLVIHGLDQWREAFAQQLRRSSRQKETTALDDEDASPPNQLSQDEVLALQNAFETFVTRLTPPHRATLREYATLIEDLIGDDPRLTTSTYAPVTKSDEERTESLGLVNGVRAVTTTARRDIAALRAFKDVLRGLILAESTLISTSGQTPESGHRGTGTATFSYAQFYEELRGAIQGTTYYLPPPDTPETALSVLSVLDARGLSFRAVALIGLAEGEFPHPEREDILLREEDRAALRQTGLSALEQHLRGDEMTLFYQVITRAREKLLLCRPYLADDGQPWEPSLYWQQARNLVNAPVQHLRPEDPLPPTQAASLQELMQTGLPLQSDQDSTILADLVSPAAISHVRRGLTVLQARLADQAQGIFEGDLSLLSHHLSATYGSDHVWSSSRLEAYGLCPHHFWLWQDLALEPRQSPQEGFDVFILGSMYHEILEKVYAQAGEQVDREHLLALLPAVVREVFDQAPAVYGFRPTPLWDMQRLELEQIVAETLAALAEITADSAPVAQEQVFGMQDQPPLVVQRNGDTFRVRGFIDRVDRLADGRLRIIDYKSGATPIALRDLMEGRRLQIALYALAARDALALGDPADGFYWHIGAAKPSSLRLEKCTGGVDGALNTAINHAFKHIAGVRAGHFPPLPPTAGCPSHCPGAGFCWRYKAKGW